MKMDKNPIIPIKKIKEKITNIRNEKGLSLQILQSFKRRKVNIMLSIKFDNIYKMVISKTQPKWAQERV